MEKAKQNKKGELTKILALCHKSELVDYITWTLEFMASATAHLQIEIVAANLHWSCRGLAPLFLSFFILFF